MKPCLNPSHMNHYRYIDERCWPPAGSDPTQGNWTVKVEMTITGFGNPAVHAIPMAERIERALFVEFGGRVSLDMGNLRLESHGETPPASGPAQGDLELQQPGLDEEEVHRLGEVQEVPREDLPGPEAGAGA